MVLNFQVGIPITNQALENMALSKYYTFNITGWKVPKGQYKRPVHNPGIISGIQYMKDREKNETLQSF